MSSFAVRMCLVDLGSERTAHHICAITFDKKDADGNTLSGGWELRESIHLYKNKAEMEAPRKYAELKGDVTTLLEDTGRFLGRLVEAPKTDGGHQLLLDTKLSDFFAKYTDLKRRKEGGLSCAVLALTKSGMRILISPRC